MDVVSGMSLIHFVAVSGAYPVGSDRDAAQCVALLLKKVNSYGRTCIFNERMIIFFVCL